jgi:hypothetical protein
MFICSKCYCDTIVRRKLDTKTAKHHYFIKIAVKCENFPIAPAVLNEGEWYETEEIENAKTGDSECDNYAIVGYWRDEVCYEQQIIERPFIFTKNV